MKLTLAVTPAVAHSDSCSSSSKNLRKILFGGTFHVFSYEWRKSFFQFRELSLELPYALETDRVRTGPHDTPCLHYHDTCSVTVWA